MFDNNKRNVWQAMVKRRPNDQTLLDKQKQAKCVTSYFLKSSKTFFAWCKQKMLDKQCFGRSKTHQIYILYLRQSSFSISLKDIARQILLIFACQSMFCDVGQTFKHFLISKLQTFTENGWSTGQNQTENVLLVFQKHCLAICFFSMFCDVANGQTCLLSSLKRLTNKVWPCPR